MHVSVDGTWQRKGFTSLNDVIAAISAESEKFLDTETLSKSCKGYTRMQAIKAIDPHACDKWNTARKCSLNYQGLPPAKGFSTVKKVGAQKIFKQTVTKHNLFYTSMVIVIQKFFQPLQMFTVQRSL